jgi:hypothetical protein
MLSFLIYAIMIAAGMFLIGLILWLLVHKKLNEPNAILWIVIGLVIMLAGLFPKMVVRMSKFFYIIYPPALVFTIAIIILLFIVLKLSIQITELTAKLQDMASEAVILKHELLEYKQQLEQHNLSESEAKQGGN